MRWKQRANSDTRIRSGFLFFPRCCGGEWRWLERATWEQKFYACYDTTLWDNVRWIDSAPPVVSVAGQLYVSEYTPPEKHNRLVWFDSKNSVYKVWNGAEWVVVKNPRFFGWRNPGERPVKK